MPGPYDFSPGVNGPQYPGWQEPARGNSGPMGGMGQGQMPSGQPQFQPYSQPSQPNISKSPPYPSAQSSRQSNGPSYIMGRFIESIDEVTPGEIPMDGSVVIFPLMDYSAIYLKTWFKNGDLKEFCFIPKEPIVEAQKVTDQSNFDRIFTQLDEMRGILLESRTAPAEKPKKGDNK